MRFTLREYQDDAISRVLSAADRGVTAQLGVAATGLGKTVIFSALAERLGRRTLILAHRDELVRQAADKVQSVWPGVPSVGIVKGPENDVGAHVVVASVQTVARSNRLARLGPRHHASFLVQDPGDVGDDWDAGLFGGFAIEPFGLVVVDEAHHAAATTYGRILDYVGAGAPGGPLLLGVTATPDRGDGVGLNDLFQEITFNYDILWGIRAGYLSDVTGQRVVVEGLNVAGIKASHGDYQVGDAGRALEEAGAPGTIAKAIREYATDRHTLAFLPTVATSEETAKACRALGMRATSVSGDTDGYERRSTLRAFAGGEIDVVTNCMVLTEGYDNPRVDCVVIGRPTKSRGLYVQMVGRGTRRHPDKTDCLVLDVTGTSTQHSLITLPTLFGLKGDLAERAATRAGSVSDLVAELEEAEIRAGRLKAEEVELFRRIRQGGEGLAWVTAQRSDDLRRRYVLSVTGDETLVMAELAVGDDDTAVWGVQLQHRDKGNRTLIRDVDLETAQAVGEDYARRYGKSYLMDPEAKWRRRPPSEKSLAAARRWRMSKATIAACKTQGELSDALTAHIEKARARKKSTAS